MPDTAFADRRASLEEERATLHRRLTDLGFGDLGKLSYDDGFADSGQVTAERGEAEALAIALREALTEVERALTKIENGTYGVCERCNQPIADARLEAKPAARLCIECASQQR